MYVYTRFFWCWCTSQCDSYTFFWGILLCKSQSFCNCTIVFRIWWSSCIIVWIIFSTLRYQWVKWFGVKSNLFMAILGVPQEGHLLSMFFFLFINSVKSVLHHCRLLCFADDLWTIINLLFMKINSLDDCLLFQSDLDWFVKYGQNFWFGT